MLLEQHFAKNRSQMACYTHQFLVQHLLFSKPSLTVVPGNIAWGPRLSTAYVKLAPYCFLKSGKWKVEKGKMLKSKSTMNISEKNDELFHLLLWQQWRFKMNQDWHLIQFISQTSSVTANIFCIKTFLLV